MMSKEMVCNIFDWVFQNENIIEKTKNINKVN